MGVAYNSRITTDGLVLALDAANKKSFYGYWSGSYGTAANAFDGNLSTFSGGAGGTFSATYTFNNGLDVSGTVRVYVTFGASSGQVNGRTGVILVDGNDISSKMAAANVYASSPGWVDVTSEVGSIFNTIVLNGTSGSTNPGISAIEVNGQILVGTTWAGTTWTDLSTNGNTGTLVNDVGYSASNGGALSFDGSNDYVDMPVSSIPSGNEITIVVWNFGIENRQSTIIGGTRDISAGPQDLNIHLTWSDGNIYWDIGNPFNRINKAPTSAEFLGWHHWAFTKNANTGIMQIYNDGNLFHSGSGLTSPIPTMQRVRIGVYQSLIYYHLGRIGPMQIYNRALSAAEISQNFNALRGRFGI